LFVQGEIERDVKIFGFSAAGRDEMEGKCGRDLMFTPVEITVA